MSRVRLLHFADAHIDVANYGRRDPETGLPVRVMDFLRALDFIINTALEEKVDLVLFAGDAFKDRHPTPTFQREWARRILRLVRHGIPVVLLVGNHDVSPSWGRAHTLELFRVFQVEGIHVVDRVSVLSPEDLGVPLYLIGIPWIHRSGLLAYLDISPRDPREWHEALHVWLEEFVHRALEEKPPNTPTVLLAHAMVPGAQAGWERLFSLDFEFHLPGGLVRDPRLDYVALGHVHKHQDLNPGQHPPVVYAGSIERMSVDEDEEKGFLLVEVEPGGSTYRWVPIPHLRPFLQRWVRVEQPEGATQQVLDALGPPEDLTDAVVRLVVECTPEVERALDWRAIYRHAENALEFRLVKRVQREHRLRLPPDTPIAQYTPLELLEFYWRHQGKTPEEFEPLQDLARRIIEAVEGAQGHDSA